MHDNSSGNREQIHALKNSQQPFQPVLNAVTLQFERKTLKPAIFTRSVHLKVIGRSSDNLI